MKTSARGKAHTFEERAKNDEVGSWRKAQDYEQAGKLYQGQGDFASARRAYENAIDSYQDCDESGRKTNAGEKVLELERVIKTFNRPKGRAIGLGIAFGLFFSLLFSANSITSGAITDLSEDSSIIGGAVLLILALIGMQIYSNIRRQKHI